MRLPAEALALKCPQCEVLISRIVFVRLDEGFEPKLAPVDAVQISRRRLIIHLTLQVIWNPGVYARAGR